MPVTDAVSQFRSHEYHFSAVPGPGTPSANPNSIALVSTFSNIESVSQAAPDIASNRHIINESEREGWGAYIFRHSKNAGNVLLRNFASVGTATAVREYVRRYLLPVLFKNIPQNAQIGTGVTAAALPVVLQIAGIARDICTGTQTAESLCSRLTNISLVIGAGAALVATDGLSSAVNALIAAIFVYVPLRDLIQYFLQLKDNNGSDVKFGATCKAATAYIINQTAVDQAMEVIAKALKPFTGETAADMLGRALVNTGGETVDDLINRGLHSNSSDNQKLDISTGFRSKDEISSETLLDQLFNTAAGRASLFSAAFSGAYAAPVTGIINSIVTGTILGAAYVPFVYTHPVKKQTESAPVSESGHPRDVLSHSCSGNIV